MYGVAFSFRSSGDHRINTPLKTFCSYSFSGLKKECPCDNELAKDNGRNMDRGWLSRVGILSDLTSETKAI